MRARRTVSKQTHIKHTREIGAQTRRQIKDFEKGSRFSTLRDNSGTMVLCCNAWKENVSCDQQTFFPTKTKDVKQSTHSKQSFRNKPWEKEKWRRNEWFPWIIAPVVQNPPQSSGCILGTDLQLVKCVCLLFVVYLSFPFPFPIIYESENQFRLKNPPKQKQKKNGNKGSVRAEKVGLVSAEIFEMEK